MSIIPAQHLYHKKQANSAIFGEGRCQCRNACWDWWVWWKELTWVFGSLNSACIYQFLQPVKSRVSQHSEGHKPHEQSCFLSCLCTLVFLICCRLPSHKNLTYIKDSCVYNSTSGWVEASSACSRVDHVRAVVIHHEAEDSHIVVFHSRSVTQSLTGSPRIVKPLMESVLVCLVDFSFWFLHVL